MVGRWREDRPVIANPVPWPGGAKCAVSFTLDMDAESILHLAHRERAHRLVSSASMLRYGPDVAVPRILNTYRHFGIKQTFFVPAWCAERYPYAVEAMIRDGHEVSAHGYLHEHPNELSDEQEEYWLKRSLSALQAAQGPVNEQIKVLTEALALESNRRELVERMAADAFRQRKELEAKLQQEQETEKALQQQLAVLGDVKQRELLETRLAALKKAQVQSLQELPSGLTIVSHMRRLTMAHWRKRNPTASHFKARLTGWMVALAALAGTLVVLSIHGHA